LGRDHKVTPRRRLVIRAAATRDTIMRQHLQRGYASSTRGGA
jgi:hypothetical protein